MECSASLQIKQGESMDIDLSLAWETLREMLEQFIALLPNIIIALIIFGVALLASGALRGLVQRINERRRRHSGLGVVLGRLTQWGVVAFGLLLALTIAVPGFTPTTLVSALGVSGIVIGFAFRDIFQNFLAGILILLTEPFRIDDQIVYKDFEGTVEEIQTRATMIKTYDGRRVVIPNAELFTNAVTVNTAYDVRRLQYDVGIGFGDDVERARELILQAVSGVEGVLADPPPEALVVSLAESSVNIRARWWIRPPRRADALASQDLVLAAIKGTLVANGIDLPFPTHQILFHDQTEETDGDRLRQREGWPAAGGQAPRPRSIGGVLRQLVDERLDSGTGSGHKPRDLNSSS
jgi:small conductance mechanosensitive channel